jgi:hypothetical protein
VDSSSELEGLRFPTGRFVRVEASDAAMRAAWRDVVAETPARLRAAVSGLTDAQLDTPYRPGGWTVRQLVHHVPDSHLNAYVRFKLGLTEDGPAIKPYDEAAWARLADGVHADIETSLVLLESVHTRWVRILDAMSVADFQRPLLHPEIGTVTLDTMLQIYAWHGPHHVAHVTGLKEREGW